MVPGRLTSRIGVQSGREYLVLIQVLRGLPTEQKLYFFRIVLIERDGDGKCKRYLHNEQGWLRADPNILGYNPPSEPAWGPAADSITVTSPNGGESWLRGSVHPITWTSTGSVGSNVKIELLKAEAVIASSTQPNNGLFELDHFHRTGNRDRLPDSDYQYNQSGNHGHKQRLFQHYFIHNTPSITVTSPNGGESWVRGSNHPITWTSTGSVGSNVKIEALKAGVVTQTLSTSTPNNGTFGWTIPTGLATGSDYKIRITSTSNSAYTDSSNSNFTITSGTTTPTITVTSPNGGEAWYKSTSHAITWSYTGTPGSTVKIVLLKAGAEVSTLAASAPIGSSGKGSYTWTCSVNLGKCQ